MEAKLLMGNESCCEGALAAGVDFFGGYPITPSNEIGEIMSRRLPKVGGKFIQMEDEIGSMACIIGASIAGCKTMTATSGPGFSLMQENLGFAAMAEVPCVIVNVMRGGPSTGLPTQPSQGDVQQARWGTHGDHPIIALTPSSVREVYDLTITSVNFAEKYRTPVVLLIDEVVGHLREKVLLPPPASVKRIDRQKPTCRPEWYKPFEDNQTGVPLMAPFGAEYRYHITGLTHDPMGFPTTRPDEVDAMLHRQHRKIRQGFEDICMYETFLMEDATIAIVTYGCVVRSARTAVLELRQQGYKAGLLKLTTLWPFPRMAVEGLPPSVKDVYVPEMNLGQMYREVVRVNQGRRNVYRVNKVDGQMLPPDDIVRAVKRGGASGAQRY